jgi:AcrR family transcriptional regulator
MPRPRSADRRSAILSAATRVVAEQGLSAATALIAKEAGVSNGSLFVYFDTKTTLLNELYVALKTEMNEAAMAGVAEDSDARGQLLHLWNQWLRWATGNPDKRRVIAQLDVSDQISDASHQIVRAGFSGMAQSIDRARADGPMRDASLGFVLALLTAVAETTIDAIINDPADADAITGLGFDAMWRMLA